jgi:K+-sensing histidine kinase KdpD
MSTSKIQYQASLPFSLRLTLLIVSILAITIISYLGSDSAHGVLYLWLLPPLVAGLFFMTWTGVICGIISAVLSGIFYRFFYINADYYTISIEILDAAVTVLVGGLSGVLIKQYRRKNWLFNQLKIALKEKDELLENLLKTNENDSPV